MLSQLLYANLKLLGDVAQIPSFSLTVGDVSVVQSYRLIARRLDRITPEERRRLNYLTLRGDGVNVSSMREDILRRKRALHRIQLFIVLDAAGTIVAWSSVLPWRKSTAYIYTYVMQMHRRQGLGTRLINRAIAWCAKQCYQPQVSYWDTGSERFFKTVSPEIKVKIADLG